MLCLSLSPWQENISLPHIFCTTLTSFLKHSWRWVLPCLSNSVEAVFLSIFHWQRLPGDVQLKCPLFFTSAILYCSSRQKNIYFISVPLASGMFVLVQEIDYGDLCMANTTLQGGTSLPQGILREPLIPLQPSSDFLFLRATCWRNMGRQIWQSFMICMLNTFKKPQHQTKQTNMQLLLSINYS